MNRPEIDEVKAWLNRARGVDEEIRGLERTRREMFERLTSVTQSYDKASVISSPDPHKLDGAAALDEKITEQINRLTMIQTEILEAICQLKESRLRNVLKCRYVDCKSLVQTARVCNYSEKHTKRLQRIGLAAMSDILRDELKGGGQE